MDIIYDFDGTLFDTYPIMVKAFELQATDWHISANTMEIYRQMRQHSLGYAIKSFTKNLSQSAEEFEIGFRQHERKLLGNSKPFNGVEQLLKIVVSEGGHNYLLTHRNQAALNLLDDFKLRKLFHDFVTGDQDFPRKPNPASMNYLIKNNQINKKTAYMIGDRDLDIDAAHNAEIQGILFDPDQLIEAASHPELKVQSFTEIYEFLDKKLDKPL